MYVCGVVIDDVLLCVTATIMGYKLPAHVVLSVENAFGNCEKLTFLCFFLPD